MKNLIKNYIKNKFLVLMLSVAGVLVLSGCASFPDLTPEESAKITEYSVSLIMKHSKTGNYRLVDGAYDIMLEKLQHEADVAALIKARQDLNKTKDENQNSAASGDGGSGEAAAPVEPVYTTLNELLGQAGVDVTFMGYEISHSYDPPDLGNTYIGTDASNGKDFLILKFNVSSGSGYADLASVRARYRAVIDGEARFAQSTLLVNDMANFRGEIQAGGRELVLLWEVPQGTSSVGSLDLQVLIGDQTGTVKLQ